MKKRYLYQELIKHLEHKNALVVTGMRQVGKTTLLRQIFDELKQPKLWFDLDNPLDQLLFEDKDYHSVHRRLLNEAGNPSGRLFVFLDEIQNYPPVTSIIKFLIDHYNTKFIVTGSSNFYLKNLFPESLSGRKFLFVLHPLSFREYLYFIAEPDIAPASRFPEMDFQTRYYHEKFMFYYEQYMEYGGFPEVVTTTDISLKRMVLKNIFASFFEKDLRLLSDFKDIRELRDMILLLVPRTGNMLDITRLSAELGINRVKAYQFIEFLQGVFFIHLIPKYSKNTDRSVAGGKKVYFSDTGMLNIIGKVNEGQLFENAVANQLQHYGPLSFYNKRNSAEIDFILDHQIAVEVKKTGTLPDLVKLKDNAKLLGIKKSYLISAKHLEIDGYISPVGI